jgi:PAS domain S-box-containing protein
MSGDPGEPASPLRWQSCGTGPQQDSMQIWDAYTGQHAEEAQGWGWLNAVYPEDRQYIQNIWRQALCQPGIYVAHCRIYAHASETYQPCRVRLVPVFDRFHQLLYWFVYVTPVTIDAAEQPEPAPQTTELDEEWNSKLVYHTLFNQTIAGILYLSLDGKIVRVNERFCLLTGYTEEELINSTLWQLASPEEVETQIRAIYQRLASGQSQPSFQMRYRRKDGQDIWLRITEFLMPLPSGEPHFFFCIVEDIDSQVKTEIERARLLARVQEEHSEAEARARQMEAVFEAITDGIMVNDKEGYMLNSNSAVKRILQIDEHINFIGLPFRERIKLLRAFDEQGHELLPDEWPMARLLRGEKLDETMSGDTREILPNGEEIYVNHTGSFWRDQNNEITGAVLVIHDVTQRRRLEQHVRKSFEILLALAEELVRIPGQRNARASTGPAGSEKFQETLSIEEVGQYLVETACQILEYQAVAIALINPQTNTAYPLAMTGFSRQGEFLLRHTYSAFLLSDYMDQAALAHLQANETIFWELGIHAVEGPTTPLLTAPMTLNNQLMGILCAKKRGKRQVYTPEEISLVRAIAKLIFLVIERERLQQEWLDAHSSELALRETNRRFDEFISIASHELRTPLAGIKGNIQLALRRLHKLQIAQIEIPEELRSKLKQVEEYLHHAEHRVNVQNRMIGDLLDVSRIQANRLELVMGPCDLLSIVREAVEDQCYSAPGRVIRVSTPEQYQRLLVNGDRDRLGQVIHNYLTNALKYSTEDKPVIVRVEANEAARKARVSVTDEGPGLDLEEQKHVWERFYRVKGIAVLSGSGPGLGLGLHISQTIIQAHQGTTGLDSVSGKGSTFWFELPLLEPLPSVSEQSVPSHSEQSGKR